MHKLETRYLFYGSKVNLGSFGVIGVKFWFSLKMHYLFYVTKYIHVIHTLASHLQNKQGNWGQSGVDVSQPAGYAVCDGNMSSSFFLSSSGNTSKTYSFNMPWPISTKLGHKNPWHMAFMSYDQCMVKGHVGVTWGQKLNFLKMLQLLKIT